MDCVEVFPKQPAFNNEMVPDRRELVVILDNIRSAQNVGSIFRTADGVGVTHLYYVGSHPRLLTIQP